ERDINGLRLACQQPIRVLFQIYAIRRFFIRFSLKKP
ncbi:MAG: hypothetical protein ACI8WB_005343, partial [Phenylobacterium sp.]